METVSKDNIPYTGGQVSFVDGTDNDQRKGYEPGRKESERRLSRLSNKSLDSVGTRSESSLRSSLRRSTQLKEYEARKRFQWKSHSELLLIIIGYSVTPDTITAFTHFDGIKNKGSILHHTVTNMLFVLPLLYMEYFMGQFTQLSCLHFGKLAPLSHGLGVAVILINVLHLTMSSVRLGDILFYSLFSVSVPWLKCKKGEESSENAFICMQAPEKGEEGSQYWSQSLDARFSSYIYWRKEVLEANDSNPEYLGGIIVTRLVLTVIVWCLVFVLVLPGIKKIKYLIKAILPTIMSCMIILILVLFLTKGSTLYIHDMYKIDLESLGDIQAWFSSIWQAIFNMSLAQGGYILCGSYMQHAHSSSLYSIMTVILNAVFSFFGFMFCHLTAGILVQKYAIGKDEIQFEDSHFIFANIPHALGTVGLSNLLTFLFFCAMGCMNIGNMVIQVFITTETILEMKENLRIYKRYIIGGLCLLCTLFAIMFATEGGPHLQVMINKKTFMVVALCVLSLETSTVLWIYGFTRLSDDIHFLLGSQPALYWKVTWAFLPAMCIFTLVGYIMHENTQGNYIFGIITKLITAIIISPLFIGATYKVFKHLQKRNLVGLLKPEDDWGPRDHETRKIRHIFNPRMETRLRRRIHTCKHSCLIRSTYLKFVSGEEKKSYRYYLEDRSDLTTETDPVDGTEEQR